MTAVCLGACSRVVSAYRRKARALSLSLSIYGMYQAIRNQFSTPDPQNPHPHHVKPEFVGYRRTVIRIDLMYAVVPHSSF